MKDMFVRAAVGRTAALDRSAVRAPAPADPRSYDLQYRLELDINRDGVVSPDEVERFGQARSRLPWMPLAPMLDTERKLASSSPQLATRQQMLARSLVRAKGSANQEDIEAVVAHLMHLPTSVLVGIERAGLSVVVCRGGVTDYLHWLERSPVRGHLPSDSWETTPGTTWNNEVVIATIDSPWFPARRMVPPRGSHHGSYDVLLHELGHAVAYHLGQFRGLATRANGNKAYADPAFLAARAQDWDHLLPYYQQGGTGSGPGADEAFAESFARFYGRDPALEDEWPSLYRFWNESNRPG